MSDGEISFKLGVNGDQVVRLAGNWRSRSDIPSTQELETQLKKAAPGARLAIDAKAITDWDTRLLIFLTRMLDVCKLRKIEVDRSGLPGGVAKLLELASAVPETATKKDQRRPGLLERLGTRAMATYSSLDEVLAFIGNSVIALSRFVRGKARYRRSDLLLMMQDCGAQALGIVTLISFLIGLILAFVGAVQLQQFGAEVYVADLVGVGMTREMASIMAAIVMAGRTGAAFAAELGTMTVNEEVDALKTLGIAPMEFLVLPRMLALALMMPLLCLYADAVGILGGLVVGVCMLDLDAIGYLARTAEAVSMADVTVGVVKGAVFGILVAISGCLRGMQCGRSSAAVGSAATSAVVTGIVFIIVADAIFSVVTHVIGV